jgi:hypothetical protein
MASALDFSFLRKPVTDHLAHPTLTFLRIARADDAWAFLPFCINLPQYMKRPQVMISHTTMICGRFEYIDVYRTDPRQLVES